METRFKPDQLDTPPIQIANNILRTCVHCGFCLATCPTYVLLGDELDSPRGRIYQIRDMLEVGAPKDGNIVKHLDRCLSCLSCMSTCPSGVDYMHLVDHARTVIEEKHTRPLPERLLRWILAIVLPNPALFRASLVGARLAKPFASYLPGRLKGLVAMAPDKTPKASAIDVPATHAATTANGETKRRVALMPGCAQKVLDPSINEATVRLLTRLGCDVVVTPALKCCGALVHHMGKEEQAREQARANISAWMDEIEAHGLDAIVINASGCGTQIKDYGHMFMGDDTWAGPALQVSALCQDISELVLDIGITAPQPFAKPVVAYHSPCSMQHGQKLKTQPIELLQAAGFEVREPKEAHLCCGSAGTYNIMQPDLADQLGKRKVANLSAINASVIATGNIGCQVQLAAHGNLPVVHTVLLVDWAMGGPKPSQL